ncbi:MAG: signal peptidase I [Arenicellales bacterium]|nr:signal peptidase I [Arenicellales bacterium]
MDFALILFIALVVTGSISLWDRLARKPKPELIAGEKRKEPWLIEYSKAFFPVILVVFLLRSFIVEPFRIPSGSMLPSLHIGDFILVNKFNYGIRLPIINKKVIPISSPERGDVMVFRFPHDKSINFIKRVVGLPSDKIEYKDKRVYVNGKPVPMEALGEFNFREVSQKNHVGKRYLETLDSVAHEIIVDPTKQTTETSYAVPEGHYFVMGDNRDHSNDSRYWGFVPEQNIIGKAFFIWFSWDLEGSGDLAWNRIGNSVK